jgi:hypothetical protein
MSGDTDGVLALEVCSSHLDRVAIGNGYQRREIPVAELRLTGRVVGVFTRL